MPESMNRFDNLLDLARLPYFERADGELRVAEPYRQPIVDAHTHLALTYASPLGPDLVRPRRRTLHYLPDDAPFDLDIYANRNFRPDDLANMKRDLTLLAPTPFGMRATHTIPNLLREMDALGISASVLLAIELPMLSSNAERWLRLTQGSRRLIVFGSVHPLDPKLERRLDAQMEQGARGIKVHPAVQMISPEHRAARLLYRACAERRLPVLFHCGPVDIELAAGRRRSQVRLYRRAIEENPNLPIILGHSGALQMEEALGYAQQYENVYLELSSQSLPNVRRIVSEGPRDRILFGTDWPFYPQALALAKVFLATEGDEALRTQVLYDNAAKLLGL